MKSVKQRHSVEEGTGIERVAGSLLSNGYATSAEQLQQVWSRAEVRCCARCHKLT